MPDLTQDYWALRNEAGAVWLDRDFLFVQGADAETFLQGQLSQDIGSRCAFEMETTGISANSRYKGKRSGISKRPWNVLTDGVGQRRASG